MSLEKPVLHAVVTIVCVFVAVNAQVFFAGRTRTAMAPALGTAGLASFVPYGYEGPIPPRSIEVDNGGSFNVSFAYDQFLVRSLREGSLPLWDPNSGLGFPHLANGLSGVLYPLNYLNLAISPAYRDLIHLLHWLLGAVFLHLYLSRLGVGHAAAAMGSVTILTGGWFHGLLTLREVIGAAVWLMFLLYAIERALQERQWRFRHVAIAAGVSGQIAAGHPEAFIPGLLCAGFYSLARAMGSGRAGAMGSALSLGLRILTPGAVAGVLVAAPVWLNFAALATTSFNPHVMETAGEVSLPLHSLPSYFLPFVFGTIHEQWIPGVTWRWADAPGWLPGAIGFLLLCGLVESVRTRERVGLFWLGALVLMGAKMWGAPVVSAVGSWPVFDQIYWPRYVGFIPLIAAAVLLARGVTTLREADGTKPLLLWLAFVAVIGAAAAMQIGGAPATGPARHHQVMWALLAAGLAWAAGAPLMIWSMLRSAGHAHPALQFALLASVALPGVAYGSQGFGGWETARLAGYSFAVFVALTLAIRAWGARLASWRLAPPLLVGAVGSILLVSVAGSSRNGLPLRYDPLTPPPYLSKLLELQQDGLYRTFAFDGAPMPNFQTAYGFPSMSWFVPLAPRASSDFVTTFLDGNFRSPTWYATNFRHPSSKATVEDLLAQIRTNFEHYSRIGVRYFTGQSSDVGGALNADGTMRVNLIYTDASTGVRIYENPRAIPRLSLVTAAGRRAGAVVSFEVGANSVEAEYDAPEPGLLVLTDTMLPGWTATLNGRAVPVELVDDVFRGIRISAPGHQRIAFSYRPPLWTVSLVLALAGGLGLVAANLDRAQGSA